MSSYTNYPHAITNQPPRIEDTKAQLHRVPEFSVSEDVSVVWEPNPTATDPLVAHSSSDVLPEGLPLGMIGRKKSEEMASFFTRVSFKGTDAEQSESRRQSCTRWRSSYTSSGFSESYRHLSKSEEEDGPS